jgi:hypothetical protein
MIRVLSLLASLSMLVVLEAQAQPAPPPITPPDVPTANQDRPGRPTFRNDTVYTVRPGAPASEVRMPGCPERTDCSPKVRPERAPQ